MIRVWISDTESGLQAYNFFCKFIFIESRFYIIINWRICRTQFSIARWKNNY